MFANRGSAPKHVDRFFLKVVDQTYSLLAPRRMALRHWAIEEVAEQKTRPRTEL